jgi:sec-independent protein translocase protein TatA
MGLSGISPMSLLLILLIVVVVFGTQKIKTLGTDLGEAVRNFRKGFDGSAEESTKKHDDSTLK